MDGVTAERGAFGEAVVFLAHFRDLPDPRQRGTVTYPLDEVLLLCLLAVLAGAGQLVCYPIRTTRVLPTQPHRSHLYSRHF